MSHYAIKLMSGELVYGTIEGIEDSSAKMVVVHNPLILEDYETEDGRIGSALVKFMVGSLETEIPISTSSIVSMAAMSDSFSCFYDVAVEVQKITDITYQERLQLMTRKMVGLVIDYQNRQHAEDTGDIVFSPTDSDNTIH